MGPFCSSADGSLVSESILPGFIGSFLLLTEISLCSECFWGIPPSRSCSRPFLCSSAGCKFSTLLRHGRWFDVVGLCSSCVFFAGCVRCIAGAAFLSACSPSVKGVLANWGGCSSSLR
ncbi:hypothetical protein QUC31_013698 [Theobroma cacao]